MRVLFAFFTLALAPIVFAAEPKVVIELAVKAHGGEDALAKATKGSQKLTGTITVLNTDLDFAGEVLFVLPDKYKMTLNLTRPGSKVVATQIVNAGQVKTLVDGKSQTLSDAQKSELRQTAANQEISLLLALLDSKKYSLKTGKGTKVGEAETVAIVVSGQGIADVTLYFDKKDFRLLRMTRQALGPDDKPLDEETTFAEFKEFGGVLLPTQLSVTRAGKKFMTMTVQEAKWLDAIEGKTFDVGD